MTDSDHAQVSVRLPVALYDRLEREAAERMLNKSVLVKVALERFLDTLRPVADQFNQSGEPVVFNTATDE